MMASMELNDGVLRYLEAWRGDYYDRYISVSQRAEEFKGIGNGVRGRERWNSGD
jgi:hypothetical protein